MDARAQKLKLKLRGAVSAEDVQELVKAGIDSPRKIRAATDEELGHIKASAKARSPSSALEFLEGEHLNK